MMNTLKRFLKDEQGLETVEWVVMGAVIVLGVALLAGLLLDDVQLGLEAIGDEITDAAATG
jgi:Flp pilus assembly pilin Flp